MKVKKTIKKTFNFFGYEIKKKDKEINELSFDEILKKKILKSNPLIIDVGANNGQSIERFSNLFHKPVIHSFEPVIKEYNELKRKFIENKDVFLNNYALGDKKEKKYFNITAKTENSSFNKINLGTNWIKKRSAEFKVKENDYVKQRQEVNIDTLDNYCNERNIDYIDILKIDTQGYEDKILEGCSELIKKNKIGIIITEIMFDNVYDKYFSFSDIEKFLIPNNFRMVGINLINNNLFSGLLFVADVMYFNKKHYKI